jgi:hypothetical protein
MQGPEGFLAAKIWKFAFSLTRLPIMIGGPNLRLTLVEKCQRSNVDLTLNLDNSPS